MFMAKMAFSPCVAGAGSYEFRCNLMAGHRISKRPG